MSMNMSQLSDISQTFEFSFVSCLCMFVSFCCVFVPVFACLCMLFFSAAFNIKQALFLSVS